MSVKLEIADREIPPAVTQLVDAMALALSLTYDPAFQNQRFRTFAANLRFDFLGLQGTGDPDHEAPVVLIEDFLIALDRKVRASS